MKRLFLLRHAKSSWDDPDMADKDRPLNARGLRDAPRMAVYMLAKGFIPDMALCSTATRTRETIAALAGVVGDFPISYEDTLYLASAERIRSLIGGLDDSASAALVVGHNPGIGSLASQITDFESLDQAMAINKFPTAALAVFETDADDWQSAMAGRLKLIDFMTPKALP